MKTSCLKNAMVFQTFLGSMWIFKAEMVQKQTKPIKVHCVEQQQQQQQQQQTLSNIYTVSSQPATWRCWQKDSEHTSIASCNHNFPTFVDSATVASVVHMFTITFF